MNTKERSQQNSQIQTNLLLWTCGTAPDTCDLDSINRNPNMFVFPELNVGSLCKSFVDLHLECSASGLKICMYRYALRIGGEKLCEILCK